jgi:hypothetical protein
VPSVRKKGADVLHPSHLPLARANTQVFVAHQNNSLSQKSKIGLKQFVAVL